MVAAPAPAPPPIAEPIIAPVEPPICCPIAAPTTPPKAEVNATRLELSACAVVIIVAAMIVAPSIACNFIFKLLVEDSIYY